ncbi:MAG: DHH family phosphoesterase [Oscillospiraceae bacterium]
MNDREFAAALCDRDAILILSHLRPDGDTLGSGAALCSALRRMGKTAYMFPNPETTARYLPYVAQFFAPADFVPACVVAVDIATPDLFPQGFSGAVDLCVDHHPSNLHYAGDTLLHAEKSACGEAVLELIELLTGSVTGAGGKPPVHRRHDGHRLLPVRQHERSHPARGGAAAGAWGRQPQGEHGVFPQDLPRAHGARRADLFRHALFPRRTGRYHGRHARADRQRCRRRRTTVTTLPVCPAGRTGWS